MGVVTCDVIEGESVAGLASQRTWLQPWIVLLVAVLAMLVAF